MAKQSGIMLRSAQAGQRGRGGKAGGKAGKRTLGPAARDALKGALENNDGPALIALATTASERGLPGAAAHIAVAAANAALGAGDTEGAFTYGAKGVELAEGVADARRVARKFAPLVVALSKSDGERATAFKSTVCQRFGLKMLPASGEKVPLNRAMRRGLPKLCGCCGEPMDAEAITMESDGTLDCPLCGEAVS